LGARVDLNCDMGESFGRYKLGLDEEIVRYVSSVNLACGFHAGDPRVMNSSVRLAAEHGVAVGAHVSLPDLVGFGRREMWVSRDELVTDVIYQLGALSAFCRRHGVRIQHVKAHGALYNMAARDRDLAEAIVDAVLMFDEDLLLFCLPGSEMALAARERELAYANEVFADRAFTPDGRLVPRSEPGAVLHDPDQVAERVARMVLEGKVTAVDGTEVDVEADTVCVHGDTPGSVGIARAVALRLEQAGVEVAAPGPVLRTRVRRRVEGGKS